MTTEAAGPAPATTTPAAALDPAAPLLAFLRGALGAAVRYAEPPAPFGNGFDTLIYRFRIEGPGVRETWARPLVLRVFTTPAQDAKARREAAVQRFAYERGYPALPPLAVETSDGALGVPFMIMERMPGGTLLERVKRGPWTARAALTRMGSLHAQLHRLSAEGAPVSVNTRSAAMHVDALGAMIAASRLRGLDERLSWLQRHADAAQSEEVALVHGDFHPFNILVAADGSPRVIDWSDAGIGDRYSDVARTSTLMSFAHIGASSAFERMLLRAIKGHLRRWYLDGYSAASPLEPRRFAWWEAAHGLRGTVQLMELHADGAGDPVNAARRLPPSLIDHTRRFFDAKVREFEAFAR